MLQLGESVTIRAALRWSMAGLLLILAACGTASHAPTRNTGTVEGVGRSYSVNGVRYVPRADPDYNAVGVASWYGRRFHGRRTANGERYNMNGMTAAHKTLPFGTKVRVTNVENGRSVVLRVNDRGPFKRGRIIDVSRHAAEHVNFVRAGTARVRVEIVQDARLATATQPGNVPMNETPAPKLRATTATASQQAAVPKPKAAVASERSSVQVALDLALEQPSGNPTPWEDSQSGAFGVITPLTTLPEREGQICRNYQRTVLSGTAEQVYVGRACRNGRSTWEITREKRDDA